jgi:hypothetical protein
MNNSTIVSDAPAATKMVSTLVNTVTPTENPAASPTKPVVEVENNHSPLSSYTYPIISTIIGLFVVGGTLFYLYATKKKSHNTSDRGAVKSSINTSGNSGRLNSDRQYNNSSVLTSSIDNTFNISQTEDRFISGYTYPDHQYNNGPKPNKTHYPNPLFAHSRPINHAPTGIRTNGSEVVDEDVNLNILTQEEVQLLRMKKKNNQSNNDGQMFKKNGIVQAPVISPQINSKNADIDVAPFNYINSESFNNVSARPEELFNNNSAHSNEYYRNEPTRPDDLYKSRPINANEYFGREPIHQNKLYKKKSDEFYYDNSFIRNLGNDIKVETKKVEYIQPEEDLINKINNNTRA